MTFVVMFFPRTGDHEEDASSVISYAGSVDTGARGDVKQIFFAINELVKSGREESLPVTIECHDIGIKVMSGLTQKVHFFFFFFCLVNSLA